MLTKKNICSILESEKIKIKKKLGQNFLISEKILQNIASTCKIKKNDVVLEIGAGMGNLTEYLASLAEQVIAVEKDPELYKILKNRMSLYPNVKVFCCDILNFKIPQTPAKKIKVVGNLPYYVSSDIIQYLISNRSNVSNAYCTLQKEFADRLLSPPGSKAYGRLSVFADYFSVTECLFKIKKENFFPVPKVDSLFIVIKLRDLPKIKVKNENFFLLDSFSFGGNSGSPVFQKTVLISKNGFIDIFIERYSIERIVTMTMTMSNMLSKGSFPPKKPPAARRTSSENPQPSGCGMNCRCIGSILSSLTIIYRQISFNFSNCALSKLMVYDSRIETANVFPSCIPW